MAPFTFTSTLTDYVNIVMHCVHIFVAVSSQPEPLELLVMSVSVDEDDANKRDDDEQ